MWLFEPIFNKILKKINLSNSKITSPGRSNPTLLRLGDVFFEFKFQIKLNFTKIQTFLHKKIFLSQMFRVLGDGRDDGRRRQHQRQRYEVTIFFFLVFKS